MSVSLEVQKTKTALIMLGPGRLRQPTLTSRITTGSQFAIPKSLTWLVLSLRLAVQKCGMMLSMDRKLVPETQSCNYDVLPAESVYNQSHMLRVLFALLVIEIDYNPLHVLGLRL